MHSLRRAGLLLAVIACLGAFALAGCGKTTSVVTGTNGQKTTVTKTSAPKTKFILHAGLAYFAFHHYIYEPYKAGVFSHPTQHKLALVKAGAAGLFVYHEIKEAAVDVKSSKTLSTLFSPLTALAGKLSSLKDDLLHGDTSGIAGIKSDLDSVKSKAGGLGATVNPVKTSIPGISGL